MSNGGAVPNSSYNRSRLVTIWSLTALLFFSGCGQQVTFEKIDHKGHVVVKGERSGEGYCFRVDKDWEIREKLEGADVVCLAPVQDSFRDSVVARRLSAVDLEDPEAALEKQLSALGGNVEIVEPWAGEGHPMLVKLKDTKYSKFELSQLLYLHMNAAGDGVLMCATTRTEAMGDRRQFFDSIVAKTEFDLANCPDPAGGVPDVFPTPEVTFSPIPANPAGVVSQPVSVAPSPATPTSVSASSTPTSVSASSTPTVVSAPSTPIVRSASPSPVPAVTATP